MKENLRRLFEYRELLFNLTRKEVKVKYKNSFLGFIWSLVTPLMMLVVFYVAFGVIFKMRAEGMEFYAFYLMAGILPWTYLQTTLASGVSSIIANGDLVKKVYFPREVLPLSYLGSASFHFVLQEFMQDHSEPGFFLFVQKIFFERQASILGAASPFYFHFPQMNLFWLNINFFR